MRYILLLVLSVSVSTSQVRFEDFFVDKSLRVDYYHIGNSTEEFVTLDRIYEENPWAGSVTNLIDPFGLGRYAVRVYDRPSNRLIYSKGYDSYFGEYRTTAPAKEGVKRTYHESVLIPFPKNKALLVFEMRDRRNIYRPLWTFELDPSDYHIVREAHGRGGHIHDVVVNGNPHEKVDIAILAEGYTETEEPKFEKDLERYAEYLFALEPYAHLQKYFNIRGVFTASRESGVDEPRQGSYRNTALGFTFNSLDSDRYLLTEENKKLYDLAADVPHDILVVMANSTRYGGGGIYGYFSVFTSDGTWNDYVFLHEFAHAFAGLGDEYYTSDVAYDEFYPRGTEPAEPNLTALLDPENLKWKDLVSPGLAIPTEWGQRTFDSLSTARDAVSKERAQKLADLKKTGASEEAVKRITGDYDARLKRLGEESIAFMEHHPLRGKIGAFEGGGYLPKGIYRPTVNSLMHQFNKADRNFFAVNVRAIERMIRWLCGE